MPRRTQALLLALLMFAASALALLLGIHDVHTGNVATSMAGRSDAVDGFMVCAGSFVLGSALLAVALGWLKFPGK